MGACFIRIAHKMRMFTKQLTNESNSCFLSILHYPLLIQQRIALLLHKLMVRWRLGINFKRLVETGAYKAVLPRLVKVFSVHRIREEDVM